MWDHTSITYSNQNILGLPKQIKWNVLLSIQFSSIQKQKFHIFLRDRKVEVIWRCYNHVFKHYQRQRNKTQDTFVRHLFQQHMVWYLCWKHQERSLKIFILKVREFSLVFFLSFYFFYNIIFFFICRIEKKGIKVSPVVFFLDSKDSAN